jgi:hypothetical protein
MIPIGGAVCLSSFRRMIDLHHILATEEGQDGVVSRFSHGLSMSQDDGKGWTMSTAELIERHAQPGSPPPANDADPLRAAFLRARDQLAPSGWLMCEEPSVRAADSLAVRFAMRRDGLVVSTCGFAIGPGRAVVFGRPGHRAVTGDLDAMGEEAFFRLIQTWAEEVQGGVGHRWRYEAKTRQRPQAGESAAKLTRRNIEHFERQLRFETDLGNRARIERLLAEERRSADGADPDHA